MSRLRRSTRLLAILTLTAVAEPALADLARPSPKVLWERIRTTRLEPDRAVEIRGLVLNTGMARFKIERGIFFPATPVGERTVEMVFQGSARLVLEPPDEIEAGQLDLFTGSPALDERVTEAVLVINLDAAADAIFGRPPVKGLDAEARGRAEETFKQWLERLERKLLGVESAIFRDAFGDPLVEGYSASWFRGEELEEMPLSDLTRIVRLDHPLVSPTPAPPTGRPTARLLDPLAAGPSLSRPGPTPAPPSTSSANVRAYRLLRKPVLKRGIRGATEGLLLRAVAARVTGHRKGVIRCSRNATSMFRS